MEPLICAKCGISRICDFWACSDDCLTPPPTHGLPEYTMSTVSESSGVASHVPGVPFAHAPLKQNACEVCNAAWLGQCWSCMEVEMGDFSPPRIPVRDIVGLSKAPKAEALNKATLDQRPLQVAVGEKSMELHTAKTQKNPSLEESTVASTGHISGHRGCGAMIYLRSTAYRGWISRIRPRRG